ncbi:hypothetical protein BV22DRAFT_29899 [Leucogyrophana mollusca]|uniref:Uncharacterized protein n=1 Tax=Leucogyrophana mollusca TaxID=85980 RepID=A0ACB8BZX8_9AGAM|nr:hypothetical protein BV22DRAFT_29899 [Leucogyrophana mollusca]
MTGILDDVHSESLQTLLSSVRTLTSPPGCINIPAQDDSRFSHGSFHPPAMLSLSRGDVLEIQGPSSSGKTHLLYHMVMICITPPAYMSVGLGGLGLAATVFDTDSSFSVLRVRQLLHTRFSSLSPMASLDEISTLVDESLLRLHVFRPTSSLQLASSIVHLASYHNAHIPKEEIGLLAVDSISTFYWSDRFTTEQSHIVAPHGGQKREPAPNTPLQHVLTAIRKFRISHSPIVVMTNWGLNAVTRTPMSSDAPHFRQHLHPFPALSRIPDHSLAITDNSSPLPLTHHITLPSVSIPPFPCEISISEAQEQEEQHRGKAAENGGILAFVQTCGSSENCRFTFRIGSDNVSMQDPQPTS